MAKMSLASKVSAVAKQASDDAFTDADCFVATFDDDLDNDDAHATIAATATGAKIDFSDSAMCFNHSKWNQVPSKH